MFGSEILEVAVGLVFAFLLLSLMATTVREAVEAIMKSRAVYLERGIRELLADPTGDGIAKAFYEHPLVHSLFQGEYDYKASRLRGGALPTYIPSRNFADAVIDLAVRGPVLPEYAAAQTAPEVSVATLRANAARLRNPRLIRALLAAVDHSGGDVARVRENLQAWYDSAMDRVSGWYKRLTLLWLFVIGLVLAALLNVDAIRIANRLWRDKPLRETLAARAEAAARDPGYQRKLADSSAYREADLQRASRELASLTLPVGWSDSSWAVAAARSRAGAGSFLAFWLVTVLGFVPSALAVTLGAPFWFDALNKIMVIRSTVKPHEKSPEESSEDRQKGTKPATTARVLAAPRNGDGRGAPRPAEGPPTIITAGAALATLPAESDADFVPNEWATGEPDEGVI